jgi:cold shock protein
MQAGTVKWFNNAKGFGFICSDNSNEDIFVHYSKISMDGYKTLKPGQKVNYEIEKTEKGYHAVNIIAITDSDNEIPKAA